MKTKKLVTLLLFFLISCLLIQMMCYRKKISFSPDLEGTLTIVGSSSTQEVCDALASGFSKKHPKVEVIKSSAGSAQAAISVANGTAQIGDLSRELNLDEKPEQFDRHVLAVDGIAVCANLKNKVKNLSFNQLQQIFNGQIKNWNEVGGSKAPIIVLGRDEASGTKINFERLINAKNTCNYSVMLDSNGKIKEKIKNDENSIGYVSLFSVDNSLKPLAIDGVLPSTSAILNSTYKLYHPFIQITLKNCHDELVNAWFNFIEKCGKSIIESTGLVPVCK